VKIIWQRIYPGSIRSESTSRLTRGFVRPIQSRVQLLNMVEENVAAQVRRSRESEIGLAGEPGPWADHLHKLHESGISESLVATTQQDPGGTRVDGAIPPRQNGWRSSNSIGRSMV